MDKQGTDDRPLLVSGAALMGAGPLVDLQFSLRHHPWRLSPAWSVLAGAIAAGAPLVAGGALLRVFAAVLLAELAWGAFFRLGLVKPGTATGGAGRHFLPYTQPESPAARLGSVLAGRAIDGSPRQGWYDLGAGVALAFVLSLLLGRAALVLSALALASGLVAWTLAQRGSVPALWLAILGIGLPWVLGESLAASGAVRVRTGSEVAFLTAAAFVVLQWGVIRSAAKGHGHSRLIWAGEAGVVLIAIVTGTPWLIIVTAGLLLMPSLRLSGASDDSRETELALRDSMPWWWAAMLATAVALRV